ncbi:hypothetical protein JCM10207_008075 [Rhodosporidiobolus poonsookiae]
MPGPPPPLPPPPRRPPPAARADSTSTLSSISSVSSMRARALAKATKIAHQTSEYAAPKLSSAAGKLRELKDAYNEGAASGSASGGTASGSSFGRDDASVLTTPKKALKSRQLVGNEVDLPSLGAAGLGGARTPPLMSPVAEKSSKWGGWGSYFSTSAASGAPAESDGDAGKAPKIGSDDVEEDVVVSFPGWATLSPAPFASHDGSEPALVLDIYAHGYAYRQRPLATASRSQRIFYALAKSFAALPKLPPSVANATSAAADAALPATALGKEASLDSLSSSLKQDALKDEQVFQQLLDIGGREGTKGETAELAEATVDVIEGREPAARTSMSDEPEEMNLEERMMSPTAPSFSDLGIPPASATPHDSAHQPHHASTAPASSSRATPSSSPEDQKILGPNAPTKLNRRPHVRIEIPPSKRVGGFTAIRSPSLPSSPSSPAPRPASGSGKHSRGPSLTSSSRASSRTSSRASSRASSPVRSSAASSRRASATPSATPSADLSIEAWPAPFPPNPFPSTSLPTYHRNLHTRLLPFLGLKLPNRKVRLTVHPVLPSGRLFDGILARKVVSTSAPSGGWKTRLQVQGKELKAWLEAAGAAELKVRVTAELLEPEGAAAVDSVGWESGYGIGGGAGEAAGLGSGSIGRGLAGWETRAEATAEDDVELVVGIQGEDGEGGGVRIISDVDDTIKWTEVLKGTKQIFRNAFVRELHEVRVPGMSTWYRHLASTHSCHFHYVSNSPWEIWPVIRAFLAVANFPSGSVTLKEYGGASSALAKLWEEPGMRKRGNLEAVMKEFPGSKFILVGDSGEQDLQVYVSLAQQYPNQVVAIFIRDVTTPFTPHSHSSDSRADSLPAISSATADAVTPRASQPPPSVEWGHSDSAADLASLIRDEHEQQALVEGVTSKLTLADSASAHSSSPSSTSAPSPALSYKAYESKKLRKAPPVPPRPGLEHRSLSSSLISAVTGREREGRRGNSSAGSTPSSSRPASRAGSPERRSTTDPAALYEPDVDPLSPNNPLRPSLPPTAPATAVATAVEAFYRRVAEAERVLPKGIVLRIFRHGDECKQESEEVVKKVNARR